MRGYLNRALAAAIDAGMVDPEGEINIALVAHFTRADLPGFRDFNRLKKRFDAVRKTYCSINRPTILRSKNAVRRAREGQGHVVRHSPARAGGSWFLGRSWLHPGFDKLSVPDVVDETGSDPPGYRANGPDTGPASRRLQRLRRP